MMAEPETAYKHPYMGYEDSLDADNLYRCRPGYAAYPSYEEKPAKKAKTSNATGGIISRFLNSATAGYEKRGARSLAAVGF
jgi:hypothetical protein